MTFNTRAFAVAAIVLAAACHHAPPPAPAPVPVKPADDGSAARARAEAARRDSVARADAAAREARERAETERRARAEAERSTITLAVYFDFDADSLTAAARQVLEPKAAVLVANRAIRVRVEGNADDRGSDEYNLALGQKRAASVKRFLVARGVEDSRVDVVSYGEERPVCKDDVESCWSRNRRDEFTILAGAESLGAKTR